MNCTQVIEPPYAGRHVRWCERTAAQIMDSLLLDCVGGDEIKRSYRERIHIAGRYCFGWGEKVFPSLWYNFPDFFLRKGFVNRQCNFLCWIFYHRHRVNFCLRNPAGRKLYRRKIPGFFYLKYFSISTGNPSVRICRRGDFFRFRL